MLRRYIRVGMVSCGDRRLGEVLQALCVSTGAVECLQWLAGLP